jgi:hypothetical protein
MVVHERYLRPPFSGPQLSVAAFHEPSETGAFDLRSVQAPNGLRGDFVGQSFWAHVGRLNAKMEVGARRSGDKGDTGDSIYGNSLGL